MVLVQRMIFPGGAGVKNPPATAGDTRDVVSIPGSGNPWSGKWQPLAWKIPWKHAEVNGVTRSRTLLSN